MPDTVDDSKRKDAAAFHRLWFESRPDDERAALMNALSDDVKAMDVPTALQTIRASDARPLLKLRAVATTLLNRPDLLAGTNVDLFVAVVQGAKPADNISSIREGLAAFVKRGRPTPVSPDDPGSTSPGDPAGRAKTKEAG